MVVAVTEAQRPGRRPGRRPVRIPSRTELTVAVNNADTVKKALACIEGLPCRLDDEYAVMLRRESRPTLVPVMFLFLTDVFLVVVVVALLLSILFCSSC